MAMAAVSIAFEAPENSRGACPSQSRPIDLVHLASQTMGDKGLEIEVLQMFARQARRALQDIAGADAATAAAAAHRLKGAAGAVGAFKVSAAAERLESDGGDAALRAAVNAAVIEAENFINKLCR
ncbi:Hpt domain-containing protein [Neorhizobium sp. CSC1952]|uniref:Hpt domain-containing protein n=1 Tax=Neorhizobium sp. CSC1952 TaxID=2978974 RepID=UPI0025A503F6|nr:Hpt domain-containing protein [Rhizobium sp. CSC1952]WJR66704.1 Hpt domain-containing protein [Rhizobium sp. CSC1952]